MDDAASQGNIFVTCTGCCDVLTAQHFPQMKDNAICCNMGNVNHEIDVPWLNATCKKVVIKPGVCFLKLNACLLRFTGTLGGQL